MNVVFGKKKRVAVDERHYCVGYLNLPMPGENVLICHEVDRRSEVAKTGGR